MPYINIRVGCRLEDQRRRALFRRTTELMNVVMGKKREVTVVQVEESAPAQWSANGAELVSGDAIGAYVDIKVTEGTNSPEQKADMIARTVEMLKEVIGPLQEACYVVIHDVRADSWGYSGRTQAARAAGEG